jgi:uncharacterized Zn finger protein
MYERYGPRLKAEGGIAAKKKRGAIGDSWWSQRFVAALEALGNASRLHRGKSYARSGQVLELHLLPGLVRARVQGSRPRPYEVRIHLPTLTPAQWAAVDEALASKALYAASLLAGEMPREIEDVFREAGQPLFPAKPSELKTECSCPDYANPCKHVAATYYILAERFDEDPFSILAWRGRERESLMEALRARRSVQSEPDPVVEAPAEPLSLEGFWSASPEALALRFRPDLESQVRALGPLVAGGRDLAPQLVPLLQAISRGARKKALQ